MTYEYKCIKCNQVIEVNRPISENEIIPKCPVCNDTKGVSRIYGNAGIIFKGNGYYCKDNC